MDRDNSQPLHTVAITELKDPSKKEKVASALSRIIKNMPADKILTRLESLPWTLTRKATPKNASRLARYLDKAGARIKVEPPLAVPVMTDAPETQILPETHLLSQTQVMAGPEEMTGPSGHEPHGTPVQPPPPAAPVPPPPPIEPGRRTASPALAPEEAPLQPGAPDEGGFPIEPLSVGGMLDRTFQICRAHFWRLLAVVAIWWGIATLIGILVAIIALVAGLTYESIARVPLWLLITMGVVLIPVTVVVLVSLFYLSQGALIHAVSSIYLGRKVRVFGSYSFALGRLRKLIFTYVIIFLLIVGVIVLATAAGAAVYFLFYVLTSSGGWSIALSVLFWIALAFVPVYVGIKLLLVDKVIIIEDIGYTEAMRRSWNLLSGKTDGSWPRGYFVRLVILLNLFILINLAVSLLFQIPAALLMLMPLPQTLASVSNHVLSNLGSVVASLFGSVCMVIFYYDIRNRKEGFDLEMLAGTHE